MHGTVGDVSGVTLHRHHVSIADDEITPRRQLAGGGCGRMQHAVAAGQSKRAERGTTLQHTATIDKLTAHFFLPYVRFL